MIFQEIMQVLTFKQILNQSRADLISGSTVQETNPLDHWAMMIYNQVDRYKKFHKIFKSPYCDVGS